MKWSKLTGLLAAALGVGTLCCSGSHLFGTRLPHIQNPLDQWSGWSFVALDLFAVLLIALSYFLSQARNWARLVVIGGCVSYSILAVATAVLLVGFDSAFLDFVFIFGILILSIAGPLFLIFALRQPEVVKEFRSNA